MAWTFHTLPWQYDMCMIHSPPSMSTRRRCNVCIRIHVYQPSNMMTRETDRYTLCHQHMSRLATRDLYWLTNIWYSPPNNILAEQISTFRVLYRLSREVSIYIYWRLKITSIRSSNIYRRPNIPCIVVPDMCVILCANIFIYRFWALRTQSQGNNIYQAVIMCVVRA